jgi:GAF domain-containing protein
VASEQERLERSIRELARFSVADGSMTEILDKIADQAKQTLEPAAMVGLTMRVNGKPSTPVFTDEEAPEIDSAQYTTGVGPCLDSLRDGATYVIPSTATDERWRPFSAACFSHGILSTLSVPVSSDTETLAALNFYARVEGAFGPHEQELAAAFADSAAVVIANSQAYWSVRQLADELSLALESRVAIEQAKGILMASGNTSAQAFDILKRASQRTNRKLRVVAEELVADAERRAAAARPSAATNGVEAATEH